jgi:hypothetical protein
MVSRLTTPSGLGDLMVSRELSRLTTPSGLGDLMVSREVSRLTTASDDLHKINFGQKNRSWIQCY